MLLHMYIIADLAHNCWPLSEMIGYTKETTLPSGWYAQPFMVLVLMLLVIILLVLVLLVLVLLVLMGLKYIEKSSITKVIF